MKRRNIVSICISAMMLGMIGCEVQRSNTNITSTITIESESKENTKILTQTVTPTPTSIPIPVESLTESSNYPDEPTKKIETLSIEPEIFHYEGTEQAQVITVDENGLLYTIYHTPALRPGNKVTQHFAIYDLDGTCIQQVDIELGTARVHTMTIEDGVLYFVIPRINEGPILYAIDVTTWEVTELATLEGYTGVAKIIPLGDYFYILGETEDYILHPNVPSFNYFGEVIGRISKTKRNSQVEFLAVDFPVGMFETKEDTLIIYEYTMQRGFGFLEFDPKEETFQEVGWKNIGQSRELCSYGDGYIFENGGLYYGTLDGIEAHITTDNSLLARSAVCAKGFVFYYDHLENMVERVCIMDILKEDKEIRLVTNDLVDAEVYGCGYQMKKEKLDWKTLSLKVLEQDSNFDLYLLNSGWSDSYNIKKNGVFYSLNEVPGVKEYLDACFPYLKEIATNENGDIWMIPVELGISGIFYEKEYCMEQGIDFSTMDYKEFLTFTENTELETPERITNVKILEEFLVQYLKQEESFDTKVFRTYAKQLRSLYQSVGEYLFAQVMPIRVNGVLHGELSEFFYEYKFNIDDILRYTQNVQDLGMSDKVGMIGVPKMSKKMKNLGTCTFFAVNPQSSNLEATLEYLSMLCTYLMAQKDTFLLEDKTTYTNTPFMQECYNLYANGEVYFAIDKRVYEPVFEEYLKGEIALEELIEELERKRKVYVAELRKNGMR